MEIGQRSKQTKWVQVKLGGIDMKLYGDTGSRLTIISPNLYDRSMGYVKVSKYRL